jgi:tetratricopeptide (TPR) repeat protein
MKLYPVTGLPAIIFIKPDGEELDRVEGYFGNKQFILDQLRPLRDGLDPLTVMEKKLAARPDSLPLLFNVMEKYLFRKREVEAVKLFDKIQKLDPQNAKSYTERAMSKMARYEESWHNDYPKASSYYRQMVERFPNSPSAGGMADAAFTSLYRVGRGAEWKDWICPLLDKSPGLGNLQRSVAMTALRWNQRGSCLAEAARRAAKLNPKQATYLDSVAVVLDGGAVSPRK